MARQAAIWFALAAFGCGSNVAYRAIEIEVRGLSARAAAMTIKIIPGEMEIACGGLDLSEIQALPAETELRWERSAGAERRFDLEPIENQTLTFVALSEDAAGQPIQYACRRIDYDELGDLPAGLLIITLTPRATDP